jgi:hypothetical protein
VEHITVNVYIYRATKEGNQVNDKHTVDPDVILDVIKHTHKNFLVTLNSLLPAVVPQTSKVKGGRILTRVILDKFCITKVTKPLAVIQIIFCACTAAKFSL